MDWSLAHRLAFSSRDGSTLAGPADDEGPGAVGGGILIPGGAIPGGAIPGGALALENGGMVIPGGGIDMPGGGPIPGGRIPAGPPATRILKHAQVIKRSI